MKVVPLTCQSIAPALPIEDNLRAYSLGEEAVIVLCEVTNTSDHLVEAGRVQAAGYDGRGWITDLADVGPLCLLPRQSLAIRLVLRPMGECVVTAALFTSCEPTPNDERIAV